LLLAVGHLSGIADQDAALAADLFQQLFFVLRIAFDQTEQIGRQIVTALELDGNATPGFIFETA
jgi:hypothetical protein